MYDSCKPTALFIGRYQPFHDGHKKLIVEGINRVGQACIAVRTMPEDDLEKNPFTVEAVQGRIHEAMYDYVGKYRVVVLPNITHVFYGRDVGYTIDRITLDAETEAISATQIRASVVLQTK